MRKVYDFWLSVRGNSFLISYFTQSLEQYRCFYNFCAVHIRANFSVVVFLVTLFVVYSMMLEVSDCVAYAEQVDQYNQVENPASGSPKSRAHKKLYYDPPVLVLDFETELCLAVLSACFLAVMLHYFNGAIFFDPADYPPPTPKKK